jgi:hypothetical protein
MRAGGAKEKSPPNISVVEVESSGPLWEGDGGKVYGSLCLHRKWRLPAGMIFPSTVLDGSIFINTVMSFWYKLSISKALYRKNSNKVAFGFYSKGLYDRLYSPHVGPHDETR